MEDILTLAFLALQMSIFQSNSEGLLVNEKINSELDIRIIDLFEAVMERPYLYTLKGTYLEAIAFLEGYEAGFLKLNSSDESYLYLQQIRPYQHFKMWISDKFALDSKDALKIIYDQHKNATEIALKMYRDFKTSF
jgi:hypothetical protein